MVSLIGKTAVLKGSELQVPRGIVIGIDGVAMESKTDITLGQLYGTHSKKFPELARIQSAVKSNGRITMEANNHYWYQLEMEGGADFRLIGQFLDNVSSDIVVKNGAYLETPLSQHRLLVERDPGGYRVPWGGWNCHAFYKTQNASAKPLSNPARFSIGGTLSYTGKMKIFGSQVSCSDCVGDSLPELENFIPFTSFTESSLCGHKKVEKSCWHHNISVINYTPLLAAFSTASDLTAIASRLELSGILSAYSVRVSGIEQGRLGQFNDTFNLQLAPMAVKQFRSNIPLLDYFTPSALYNMSTGGDMVFKSFSLLKDPTPRCPRLLLQKDGSLNFDTQNLRRLFAPQQEERFLTNLMMTEFGRHFLSPAVSGAGNIMCHLENNTLRYHQQGKKLIENLETTLAQAQHSGALTVQSSNIAVPFRLEKPCIADAVVTLIREDGTSEQVTCPTLFFPESFNNRRLQDGAGCLFSLGEIYLAGGGRLHIRGNLDAEGLVTYENFELVERVRNTYTRYETVVTQETKSKNLMGKTKKMQQLAQIAVTELQPGAEVRALGERYTNVKNVHFKGTLMLLGSEGLSIKGADFVLDEAIIQNQPGALLSKKQKGCLGLGGSTISSQVVLQRAIGSVIRTPGRIQIEAKIGVFQATLFGDENGNKKVAEFEISELDYHGLLKAVEEDNQSRTQALNASLAEQARTSRRKATQGTMLLLASLPIVYYTGGFLSNYLQGAMGVTLSTATVAGTATTAQTATIVGLSGAGAAAAGAVVQGNNPIETAANGAFFAWLGNVVANASVLKNSAQMTKAVARSMAVATAQTVIKGGDLLENVAVAGAAAVVATTVFPGDPADLSLTENIAKNMLEATVITAASNGSLEALAVNVANAGAGAMIEKSVSDLGGEHGARVANASHPTAPSNAQATTASSSSSSVSRASCAARATEVAPQRPQPTRRSGLVGSDFECELNAAHRNAHNLFLDAEMKRSFNIQPEVLAGCQQKMMRLR